MFKQTWSICTMGVTEIYRHPIPNAILESMLLHLRILTEILISKGYPDDIKLNDQLLSKYESQRVDELRTRYGTSNTFGSPCWTLNKMLAHPSLLRSNSYNYDLVLKVLLPCILPLLDEIERARRVFSSQ